MSYGEGFVLPKPGIPKTLGILNIIFGVMGLLYGLCTLTSLLVAPLMISFAEKATKEIQVKAEAQQKAQIKQLDDRAAAAKTDEEKKEIEKDRADLTSNPPPQLDLNSMTAAMRNPTILAYSWSSIGVGILICILMIVSGIGLLQISAWGRSMAIWLAAIGLLALVTFTSVNILVVQPINAKLAGEMLEKIDANARAQGAPPNAGASIQAAKLITAMGTVGAVIMLVVLSIYPITSLILLNTPGARAACLPKSG